MSRNKADFQRQPPQPKSESAIRNKVEVQKGPINAAEKTSKMKTHPENLKDAFEQAAFRRGAQTLKLHEPKSGRK